MSEELARGIVREIKKMGYIKSMLEEIVEGDYFDHISKHDPCWDEDSVCSDRLWEARGKLMHLEDKINQILSLISDDGD